MGRGSESFQKRQREKNKRERAAAKQARRHGKLEVPFEEEVEAPSTNGKSEAELYEDFRLLSEKYQSGGMDEETYEKRRVEIFEQLGLEVH
ncbi:MAG: hypothetical protein OXN95_06325 [bacterium]|nr:hypothetical protein [bacterium]MXZ78924.1 hypothetical protein [Acidimicrobiia bacterium]MYE73757.1 hypothetical protein [Acidimicrobiia bacterium]MYJ62599.1 hypothetical protein [Acidimicrobiia bacterium]